MPLTLEQLNTATLTEAAQMLDGLYEHSPWIAEQALAQRPFGSLAQLKHAMTEVLRQAGVEAQLALIRAHPELAGKALQAQALTAESSHEQNQAGLTHCTPTELARIAQLNADYHAKFGWPFILAVRGPRGTGLKRQQIIDTLARRWQGQPDFERQECLRNIHRIAEIRLNDKFGFEPTLGNEVWDWHETLALHSDPGYAEAGQLTVTYLSGAHRACASQIGQWLRDCGFDEVGLDAVGNVVGLYHAAAALEPAPPAKRLLTGSHYDTVRDGGKYDGRLGILVPMAAVRELHRSGCRLPFAVELVAFAEEEGQRYQTAFLGSSALTGDFKAAWLDQCDADGITLRAAMHSAGLQPSDIPGIRRDPARYLGFVEVHIEQGPVLNELNLPLGVVSSINASVRYLAEVTGVASHAGTTPMSHRRDAACAVAELALALERCAAQEVDSVATIGQWHVPNGSTNVVPGRCLFSLDLRAPTDAGRDALERNVLHAAHSICRRRGVDLKLEQTLRVAAAPSAPAWQQRWEDAVAALGLPLHRMPSGAGHDAMKLHDILPQAMLFVRGQNGGISHNPLEACTSDDMQLAVAAFTHLLHQLADDTVAVTP